MPYHSSFEKDTNDYVEPNEVNLLSCVQIVDGADQPADSEERDFRKLIMEERLFMKKKMEEHYKRLKFFKSKMLEEMHFIEEMSDNYSKTQHEFDSSTEEMTKEKDCCTKFVENKTKSSERNSKETSNSCVPQGNDQKKKQVLNAAQLRKEALTPRDLSTNFSQLDSVETGHKDERTESESADSEEKLVIGSERYEDMNQTYEQLDLRLERDRNQPTFMDAALESADRKKLKEYCLLPRQYSQSTLRKHNWVLRLLSL
ncbi:uncharacterized protein MONOS_17001 [Monocercomonoides exilis]|uniref:uncharacterized protein n=1 Tax=Monocercomonoides exilis TaxID=2049356 RepID=UPI0035598751|nr:hypothetical protein MONOS_17001 [Monocercomonoides exilis]